MNRAKYYIASIGFLLCIIPIVCSSNDIERNFRVNPFQGGIKKMDDYFLGRFSIKVPTDMNLITSSQRFRECEIEEFNWQHGDHEVELSQLWKTEISKIENRDLPRGIKKAIIDLREVKGVGRSAKGVFYFGDNVYTRIGNWKLLVDTGSNGLWMNFWGNVNEKEEMLNWVVDIAKNYHSRAAQNSIDTTKAFHLKNGFISLPYIEQESTRARFEQHSLDLKLEIEMHETHKDEPKGEGLLARTAAAIFTGYATGVDIKRLRSKKRKVAGLDGEEEVDRMRDKYRTAISFGWRYAGRKDSGEYPQIVIRMESPDGNLEAKLKVWDAILDSIQPLYK